MEVNEAAVSYGNQKVSIEEYLEIENAAAEKHEYYKGDVFAMPGAKHQHNVVKRNLFGELINKLKGKDCQPLDSDSRVHIERNTLFTYPDISIVCGEPVFLNDDEMNLLNPSVIIEVLSPSTKDYDRGNKFGLYRDISSLREYILVEPETIAIEAYAISNEGKWILQTYNHINDVLTINTASVSIPLATVYEGTKIAAGIASK